VDPKHYYYTKDNGIISYISEVGAVEGHVCIRTTELRIADLLSHPRVESDSMLKYQKLSLKGTKLRYKELTKDAGLSDDLMNLL
jgi:hypothetical protein